MKFEVLEKQIDDNHAETIEKLGESDRRNHDKQVTMLNVLGDINLKLEKQNGRVKKTEAWIRGIVMCCVLIVGVVLPLLAVIYNQINDRFDRQSAAIIRLQDAK